MVSVVDQYKVLKQILCFLGHMKCVHCRQFRPRDQDSVTQCGPSRRAAPLGRTKSVSLSSSSSCSQNPLFVSHMGQRAPALSRASHLENSLVLLNVRFSPCLHLWLQGISYTAQPHVTQCIFYKMWGEGNLADLTSHLPDGEQTL